MLEDPSAEVSQTTPAGSGSDPRPSPPTVRPPRVPKPVLEMVNGHVVIREKRPQLRQLEESLPSFMPPSSEQVDELRRAFNEKLFTMLLDQRCLWSLQQLLTCKDAKIRMEAWKIIMMSVEPPMPYGAQLGTKVQIINHVPRPGAGTPDGERAIPAPVRAIEMPVQDAEEAK